ncbi:MauE/DoxX family redox-associated membrane protein [Bacillus cereus]
MKLIIIFKIILGIIFLKSSFNKLKKPYQFYKAIEDYKFIHNKFLLYIVPLLIVIEQVLSLCLILPVNPLAFLILGIILQSFYVFFLLLNIGKNFKNNCQCFSLNAPGMVTTKNISINIALLISIILTYGWLLRLENG